MRLFVAINFMPGTISRLAALRDELRAISRGGNFTLTENLHLTLVFLGDCDERQVKVARTAIDGTNFAPFDLMIESIGKFKRDGGDLWWAGARENKPLMDLQCSLTDNLSAVGFVLEKRKFSPHITLGRKVISNAAPHQIDPFGETVTRIDLMKSEHIGSRLTYTTIHTRRKNCEAIL